MKITTKIFSMLMIAASFVVVSCKDEFTEEDALAAQQEMDLAIYVFNKSVANQPPVAGLNVTVSQGGESRTVATNEAGVALFPDAKIGGYVYRIEGENFTTLAGSNSFDPENFRQGQHTEQYGVYDLAAENMAIVKGRIAIEKDLTNKVTEYASGIELIFEVDLDDRMESFAATTDEEGRYEIQLPANYNSSTYVNIRFPDLEIDQTLAYAKTSDDTRYFPEVLNAVQTYPTLFSMFTGNTQNTDNFPNNINPVYALAEEGEETAVIGDVRVNNDGEVYSVSFYNGGNYSDFAKDSVDVTFTDITGSGSGALLRISVETYSSLAVAYNYGHYRWVSQGSGYQDDDDELNYNGYEEPTVDQENREASVSVHPGTVTVFNADYGTGVYRDENLDSANSGPM